MALGYSFRLELADGTPADPATFSEHHAELEGGCHDPVGDEVASRGCGPGRRGERGSLGW